MTCLRRGAASVYKLELGPMGLSDRVVEDSPARGCAPAAALEDVVINGLSASC